MGTWSGHSHDRQRKPTEQQEHAVDEETRMTPSQAEGDRETVEENLDEGGQDGQPDTGHAGQGDIVHTPSQAEGDREAIERSLEEKDKQ